MTGRQPHREHSRAVLIGAGAYDRADRLQPIPAVANNLHDLHALLAGDGGVLEPQDCRLVLDPVGVTEAGEVIEQAAEQASDTLIVYYTGHGLLDTRGRLYLALPRTDPDRTRFTALPIATVREAITESRATTRVLILDCCFSGRAIDALTDGPDAVLGQADIAGTYTITSSSRTETSYAPTGHRNTAFTAAFLAVATRHPGLTIDDLYSHAEQHLRRNAHPDPRRRADNNAGQLILFPRATLPAPRSADTPQRPVTESAASPVIPLDHRVRRRRLLIGAAVVVPVAAAAAAGIPSLRSPSTSIAPTGTAESTRPSPATSPRLTGTPDAVLTGHTGPVWAVAFNPDGSLLATGSADKTVRLWDVATGKQVGEPLIGHAASVWSVAFSPDGTLLATGGDDKAVRLWGVASREPVLQPPFDRTSLVWSLAFNHDGSLLATTGGIDKTVRLWDVATGGQVGQLTGHTATVRAAVFNRGGTLVASGGEDDTVRVWVAATREQLGQPLLGHTAKVLSVAFAPGGGLLATGGSDQTVRLWRVANGERSGRPLTGHTSYVTSVAFNPDGYLLATGSDDRTVRLWEVATGELIGQPLAGHSGTVTSVAFSPSGNLLATSSSDQSVRLWR